MASKRSKKCKKMQIYVMTMIGVTLSSRNDSGDKEQTSSEGWMDVARERIDVPTAWSSANRSVGRSISTSNLLLALCTTALVLLVVRVRLSTSGNWVWDDAR